jgi:hypothetical protein
MRMRAQQRCAFYTNGSIAQCRTLGGTGDDTDVAGLTDSLDSSLCGDGGGRVPVRPDLPEKY